MHEKCRVQSEAVWSSDKKRRDLDHEKLKELRIRSFAREVTLENAKPKQMLKNKNESQKYVRIY